MNIDVIQRLAKLPARQLHLLLGGMLLVTAALLWTYAIRTPLAALRAAQAERVRLESGVLDANLLAAQLKALEEEVATLSVRLGLGAVRPPSAQMLLGLIGEMNALAASHGVTLSAANPAEATQAVGFDEIGFDAEATGSYQALLAWMTAVEAAAPNIAVARFEMSAGKADGQVELRARIVAYLPREAAR